MGWVHQVCDLRTIRKMAIPLLVASIAPAFAFAGAGEADMSFGSSGVNLTSVGVRLDSDSLAFSTISLSGGGYVTAGYSGNGSNDDITLVRYDETGALSADFGDAGIVMTAVGSGDDQALSAIEDRTGKLVVAGYTYNGSDDDFALLRYDSTGVLDEAFGIGGIVTTDVGGGRDQAYSVIEDSSGNFVVAGTASNGGDNDPSQDHDIAIARYDSSGVLDASFGGGDGIVRTPLSMGRDVANSIIEDRNGNLVIAGFSPVAGTFDFVLVRYDSSGNLDTSFGGGDGIVVTDLGTNFDYAHSVIEDANGNLVVAGRSTTGGGSSWKLVRYDSEGELDLSFGGGDGVVDTPAMADVALSVIEDSNGHLVLAGSARVNTSTYTVVVARYDTSGELDPDFASEGVVLTPVGSGYNTARSVIQDSEGRLVVTGYAELGGYDDFVVLRYGSSGALDTSFGSGGVVTTSVGASYDHANSVVEDSNRNLIVAGATATAFGIVEPVHDFAIARYSGDGTLDSSFGAGDGVVSTSLGADDDQARSVIEDSNGNIVVAGISKSGFYYNFALVRYDSEGALDSSFGGGNGIVKTSIGSGSDYAYSLIEDESGRLVVAGYTDNGANNDLALARYDSAGGLDASFGSSGIVTTDLGGSDDRAYSLIADSNGRLVVAGETGTGEAVLARYDGDGRLDLSFGGGDGIVTTQLGTTRGVSNSVIQDRDGNLVVAGFFDNQSGGHGFALARYDEAGDLDLSFGGGDGIVVTEIGSSGEGYAYSVIEDSSGRLVVAGYAHNGTTNDVVVVRYDHSGVLDTSFGAGTGIVSLDTGLNEIGRSLLQDQSGDYVVAGYSSGPNQFLVTRLKGDPDQDSDGIPDSLDAFPENPAAAQDEDDDGLPDAWNSGCDEVCQSDSGLVLDASLGDSDNDGVINEDDHFPYDTSETIDSDSDGVGDNADVFPYDSSETADADGDGIGDNADENDAEDTNPPHVTAPSDLVIDATGVLNDVDLGMATANDFLDGSLTAIPDDLGPFNSGVHYITWSATDKAGNIGTATQLLTIYPQVGFDVESQIAAEGAVASVKVALSGPSPVYPVHIPVFLDGASTASPETDHTAEDIVLTIGQLDDPANEASFSFNVEDDGLTGEESEFVQFFLDDTTDRPYVGQAGVPVRYLSLAKAADTVVILTEHNLPPAVSVAVTQAGKDAYTVLAGSTDVQVVVAIDDPNPKDTHGIAWYIDNVLLPEYTDMQEGIIPAEFLTEGLRTVRLEVTDSGSPPEVVVKERAITVNAKPLKQRPASTDNSDGGGPLSLSTLFGLAILALSHRRKTA